LNFTSGASAGGDFTSDEEASSNEEVPLPLADDQAAEEVKTETPAEKETEVVTDTTPVVKPEFKASALSSQKEAKARTNLSYVITVQGEGGFSQSLTLSVSGMPEKVETSFSSPAVKLIKWWNWKSHCQMRLKLRLTILPSQLPQQQVKPKLYPSS